MGEESKDTKEKRSSILGSISSWLQLVGLIVLVIEGLLLLAMSMTPADQPIFKWYPITMILLGVFIILALFFDNYFKRKSDIDKIQIEGELEIKKQQSIKVEDKVIQVDSKNIGAVLDEGKDDYTNSLFGYSFNKPTGEHWKDPQSLTYPQFIRKLYMNDHLEDEVIESLIGAHTPYGNLMFHCDVLEIQYGEDMSVDFNENTTTDYVEFALGKYIESRKESGKEMTEEEIQKTRMQMNQTDAIDKIGFTANLRIMTMEKSKLDVSFVDASLPNLFMSLTAATKEPLESIVADDESILWNTANKLRNVSVKGEDYNTFYIYRLYRLVQSEKYIYLCAAQWSPQLESAVFAWESLKTSFESFKVKA